MGFMDDDSDLIPQRKPDPSAPLPQRKPLQSGTEEPDGAGRSMMQAPQESPEPPVKRRAPPPPTPGPGTKGKSVESAALDLAGSSLNANSGVMATPTLAQLKTDNPYGDGRHSERGHDTLRRIGADMAYGRFPKGSGLED
jgi:hypothetical protein